MPDPQTYIEINRDAWNQRAALHVDSAFYDMPAFLQGKNSLNDIELSLLGDVSGKKILHLQCHFGQDSLSLARMGAVVTGVDLSDKAIALAEGLAKQTSLQARFICSDLFALPGLLNEEFDIVFTSYGTIGWLPDIGKWASIVHRYLKPGGRFIMAEFHPVVWMFDNDFQTVAYKYFHASPIIETEQGSYANKDADVQLTSMTWNHGLAEVINSLLGTGLRLMQFHEYDYSPYNCFNHCVEAEPGKYRISHLSDKIPMVFAIEAIKPEYHNNNP